MEYFRQRFIDELNEEGDIEIAGNRWPRHDVLERMDDVAERDLFNQWVNEAKQAAKERAKAFLAETQCLERFRRLANSVGNGAVVPFVGAGMSVSSGFRTWSEFLRGMAADDEDTLAKVSADLALADFEGAAQKIADRFGPGVFDEEIVNQLGSHRVAARGPVQLLPQLFDAEVMTTNLDYVLPAVYNGAQVPFSSVFCGSQLRGAPARIGNDPHVLLRLHGEGELADGRVLTTAEYDAAYGPDGVLPDILSAIIGLRSLLFLGCSLQMDRTVAALRTLRGRAVAQPPRHYAFLPLPSAGQRAHRRQFLSEAEIHPIYYPADDHDQCIEDLLITLMEGGLDD